MNPDSENESLSSSSGLMGSMHMQGISSPLGATPDSSQGATDLSSSLKFAREGKGSTTGAGAIESVMFWPAVMID